MGSRGLTAVAVVAPPGYGKTTLLVQWAARDGRPFAWVALHPDMNDPGVLLAYLAAALEGVIPLDPQVTEGLASPNTMVRSEVIGALLASIAGAPHDFVLVLDDCHLISDEDSFGLIELVVHETPAGAQVAISGRADGHLPLARMRAEGRVFDLGPDDLRFGLDEARTLLEAAGMSVDDTDLAEIATRTEGWAVGLYLAALAHAAGSPNEPQRVAFSGDDRLLADYVRAEILSKLSEGDLRFLTRSSLLDEMSGALCDTALDRSGSGQLLEVLEASNLLIVPLDRNRTWYRYHHLFRDLLRRELEAREPDLIPELARRAAEWCGRNGRPETAVMYAQMTGQLPLVERLVLHSMMPAYARGLATTIQRWLEWLADNGTRDIAVAVLAAWVHVIFTGRTTDAERWAEIAEHGSFAGPLPDGTLSIDGWRLALRAAMCPDGIEHMREDAERALEMLARGSQFLPTTTVSLGLANLLRGDLETADELFARAVDEAAEMAAAPAWSVALAERAAVAMRRDAWADAATFVRHAALVMREGRITHYPSSAFVWAITARLAAHDREPDEARAALAEAASLCPRLTHALAPFAAQTQLELARACVALGDVGGARVWLTQADSVMRRRPSLGSLSEDAANLEIRITEIEEAAGGVRPLTPAEKRILPLLATQMSFPEIAGKLFVTQHTVKAHAASIYRKLGASSRTQAVEKARNLGQLPT